MDTTLLLLALLTSICGNMVLGLTVLLVVRGGRRGASRTRAAAGASASPAAGVSAAAGPTVAPAAVAAPGSFPAAVASYAPAPGAHLASTPASRRAGILEMLQRGAARDAVASSTGATRGEIDLVARLAAFDQAKAKVKAATAAR